MTGVELPVIAYVIAGIVVAGIFGFAIWRNVAGKNKKNKKWYKKHFKQKEHFFNVVFLLLCYLETIV